jgi:hypothetical protein
VLRNALLVGALIADAACGIAAGNFQAFPITRNPSQIVAL